MAGDWCDLRRRLFAALSRPTETGKEPWRDAWEVFASDPWYQSELTTTARRVVVESGAPLDLAGDVAQEATLLLARDLRRDPSLGSHRVTDEAGFGRWMRTIITRQCRQSMRRIGRARFHETEIRDEDSAIELIPELELRLDLHCGLKHLSQAERSVVLLYTYGASFGEIAEELRQRYHTVYSIWRRSIERLRGALASESGA